MVEYICAVGGVLGKRGKLIGMCSKIKCGSDDCGFDGECDHKLQKCECGGKLVTFEDEEFDAWKECDSCGSTL